MLFRVLAQKRLGLRSLISGPVDFSDLKIASASESLPRETQVVVCGGGIIGASVAYHLAEIGWGGRTILVEQTKIGGAPTWNSSGLVGIFKPTLAQVRLCQTSMEMFKELESKGYDTGWKKCGSLCLARTNDRMTVFRRMKALSVCYGRFNIMKTE